MSMHNTKSFVCLHYFGIYLIFKYDDLEMRKAF